MSSENENISKDSWSEYGRLVLRELERLNEGQDELRKDLDKKFQELNGKISEFKNTEKDVTDLKKWKESVTDVWSTTQMKESKDEIYKQKGIWQKVTGIIIAVQILVAGLIWMIDKIIK